ncbi:MAG: uracil phosphoribosyltransferase [Paludibacteraceae bacterium]|nr:uracil phosphoribosyltransferase [Paludibacteraceae bacterium]
MQVHHLSEHNSVLNHYLKQIRHVGIQTDSMRFRRNIERIGEVMAYEVSKTLPYATEDVPTPLGTAQVNTVAQPIVLGTILRAGLPLHQGFLNVFDDAENAFISAFRRIGTNGELEIVSEYLAAPALDGKILILVDPMLASGASMEIAYKALLSHGTPAAVHLCSVIAAPEGIELLQSVMPKETTLWCAAIDDHLNENKYIVPGLGDAGDLCFGDKL